MAETRLKVTMNQPERTESLHGIFSTPLWVFRHFLDEENHPKMIAEIDRLRSIPDSRSDSSRSNVNGWRSKDLQLTDEPWRELFKSVSSALSRIIRPSIKVKIQAWVNVHDHNGYNKPHIHSGCIISGIYYLSVPEGSGSLVVEDPRPQAVFHNLNGLCFSDFEEYRATIPPEEGMLIFFPSWLSHCTEPSRAESPRISIPINVVLDR